MMSLAVRVIIGGRVILIILVQVAWSGFQGLNMAKPSTASPMRGLLSILTTIIGSAEWFRWTCNSGKLTLIFELQPLFKSRWGTGTLISDLLLEDIDREYVGYRDRLHLLADIPYLTLRELGRWLTLTSAASGCSGTMEPPRT